MNDVYFSSRERSSVHFSSRERSSVHFSSRERSSAIPHDGGPLTRGTDPAALTRQSPDRIAHTHLKDVDATIAAQVRAGRLTYTDGVARGLYRPLGTADVDIAAIVNTLQGHGYEGWYVLEQDTVLTEEPHGEGPVHDVRTSADDVSSLLTTTTVAASE